MNIEEEEGKITNLKLKLENAYKTNNVTPFDNFNSNNQLRIKACNIDLNNLML